MAFDSTPVRRLPRLGQAHGNVRPALTIAPLLVSAPQHGIASATKGYDAARQDRLTSDWTVSRLSADAELQGKLPIIRDRCREHARNEPLAKNFLTLVENNVIGDKGFTFESKIVKSRSIDPETGEEVVTYDAETCRKVERAWKQFGHRDTFLTTRNMDMTAAWKLIARTMWGDGDCLLRLVRGYPNKFGFAVQLLEPDFLDDQFIEFRGVPCNCPEELTLPDGRPFPKCQRGLHQVRMGVELHCDWMFPLAYWMLADHLGDYFFGNQYNTRRTRVPVSEIIHPFVYKRMGQTRGVSEKETDRLQKKLKRAWDNNALRHSYGTHRNAELGNAGQLAEEMGTSIAMVRRYYDAVPADVDPQEYFGILPGGGRISSRFVGLRVLTNADRKMSARGLFRGGR